MSRQSWALTGVIAVVLAVGAVMLPAGALEAGITLDEPTQVNRTAGWLEHGWYVPPEWLVGGEPEKGNPNASPYVYGPAFASIAHVLNVVLGNEGIDDVAHTKAAYTVRHLTSVLVAIVGILAVAFCVFLLTSSWFFAFWAAAALVAIPGWTGQAFFNSKDIPAAVGYTLLTAGLVLALVRSPGPGSKRAEPWIVGATVAAGVWLGAGTRLGLLPPFAATVLVYAALRLCQARLGRITLERRSDLAVALGAMIGLAGIVALYPNLLDDPSAFLTHVVSASADFPYGGSTLTAGHLLSGHPPWWYLPVWIAASLPVLIAVIFIAGSIAEGRALTARRQAEPGAAWRRRTLGLALVLQQALMVPIAAIVFGSVMYGGMRQHLYVLPAVAIGAGIGAHRLWSWATSRQGSSALRHGSVVVLSLALLIPLAEQIPLFPYGYTYVNPIAGIGGVNGRWETDYWFASLPEAISHVPAGAELRCRDYLNVPGENPNRATILPCGGDRLDLYLNRQGTDATPPVASPDQAWAVARRRSANRPPSYCREANDVTRWLRGESVIMAYVLRCSR